MLQETLTKKQSTIFNFIRQQIVDSGNAPTIREIADEMGFRSPNGVICHLTALEKKGLIHRGSHKSRAITLTEEAEDELNGLPLVGTVQAGTLHEAVEQNERIDFGTFWTSKGNYVLQVEGDSMIDAQIAPGDYVVVKTRRTADRGDMVIARTSDAIWASIIESPSTCKT
ncbi:MAG: transcriptional repressor LexA [Planctomycetota bacterium]